jgi:hypothetical protein
MLTHLMIVASAQLALAEDGCEDHWSVVEEEGAYYTEGVGCIIGDISLYCAEMFDGDCWSWDQVVARYEDYDPDIRDNFQRDCAMGSDYAHVWDRGTSEWEEYLYYDDDGFAAGSFEVTFGDPWCCDGTPATHLYHGDPYATCIEPTDTGDTDTTKTGPCGAASGGGAAVLLTALTLGATRRRRQP